MSRSRPGTSSGSNTLSTSSTLTTLRTLTTRLAIGALVLGVATGLAACATPAPAPTPTASVTSTPEPSTQALPPIIVTVADAAGTTVEVPLGNVVDLVVAGDNTSVWSGSVANGEIVEFVPGNTDGSATFNPGLAPLQEGTSEVTLTNTETSETVTFTVVVTAFPAE